MTLFRAVEPIAGESLPGLIARAAEVNVYPTSFDVLAQARLGRFHPEAIALRDISVADDLARVLGTSPESLRPLFHPTLPDGKRLEFFGTHLRSVHREPKLRRVSPRALQVSPHHRAVWQLRPFMFDPGTKEYLLSACPLCESPLGFHRTKGIAFCDHCQLEGDTDFVRPRVDLREFPQPLVEVDDEEALDFVTGLVDPDPEVRTAFSPKLHHQLANIDRGDLFEMVLALATALTVNSRPDYVPASETAYRSGVRETEPAYLAAAGRGLMNWPQGFVDLSTAARSGAADRPYNWGPRKELGAIGTLTKDAHVTTAVRDAFAAGVDRYFASTVPIRGVVRRAEKRNGDVYVGAVELMKQANVGSRLIGDLSKHPDVISIRKAFEPRSPAMFSTFQMSYVLRDYKDLISEGAVSTLFGVPHDGIRDLSEFRHLVRIAGTAGDLGGPGAHYSRAHAMELHAMMLAAYPVAPGTPGFIPVMDALLLFPAGRRPWLGLLEAIWMGKVDAVFHRQPTKSLLAALSVRDVDRHRQDILDRMNDLPAPDVDAVTTAAANLMIGNYHYDTFRALVAAKLLSINSEGKVPYAEIIDLTGRYIFANEVAARAGLRVKDVADWFHARSIGPARDLGTRNGLIFDRARFNSVVV
jgi:hypothetical protein